VRSAVKVGVGVLAALVSWLVSHDVRAGRKELDFSIWGTLSLAEQAEERGEIAESLAKGEMPPWYYNPMHPDARLSAVDQKLVDAWTGPSRGENR
jgi:hypothetical protein